MPPAGLHLTSFFFLVRVFSAWPVDVATCWMCGFNDSCGGTVRHIADRSLLLQQAVSLSSHTLPQPHNRPCKASEFLPPNRMHWFCFGQKEEVQRTGTEPCTSRSTRTSRSHAHMAMSHELIMLKRKTAVGCLHSRGASVQAERMTTRPARAPTLAVLKASHHLLAWTA